MDGIVEHRPAGARRGASSVLARRVEALDWPSLEGDLDRYGVAKTSPLLAREECESLAGQYDDAAAFRSRVVMARHGFGRGEYQYYAYPLPEPVEALRTALYPQLARTAARWSASLGINTDFPEDHADFLARCNAAGQTKPTPLLLRYEEGDYNCLHQDLYGEHVFPLQLAVLLSEPGRDFAGGDFVLVEQRPRMQSRVEVVRLRQGEAVIFAVHSRPVQGARGVYCVNMRHGVSRVAAGRRHTLGIILHDAA